MKNSQDIEELLKKLFEESSLILATLSQGVEYSKVIIRPIDIQGKKNYQISIFVQEKVLHSNYSSENCLEWLKSHFHDFKQTFLYTTVADYHLLVGKKGNITLLTKKPTKNSQNLAHNRKKNYLLEEGKPIDFLVELGVMNANGKVLASKGDKFRQINHFLEMINDILSHLDPSKPIQMIDFGCGKAYLTFALYYFFKIKGYKLKMIGLDLKSDVIQFCQKLACTLGYEGLQFIHQDINQFEPNGEVDLVVSLHACDTATDAALEKAIRWQSKVILAVPCCQHELLSQIEQEALRPLLKHGILKERFAALATDAARVQLLDVLGYQTQIIEFIDIENTPKNLLIRAIKRTRSTDVRSAWEAYLNFKRILNIHPSLERRFHSELS